MNTVQKILAAAVLTVVGAVAVFEAHQSARFQEQNQLLQRQQASLAEQIRQLQRERDEATNQLFLSSAEMRSNSGQPPADEQFRELLRLRGTVGVLRQQLAEAAKRAQGERAQRQQLGQWLDANKDKLSALRDIPVLGELFRTGSNSVDGLGRTIAPENLAPAMMDANPAAAFAYAQQLSPADRRKFLDSAFAAWARKDTEAALQGAEQQLSDPAEKDAALQAIRSVAPVGIGAELAQRDGYAVVNRLFPGSPAELSGQFHPGDRIVAVAQGDNAFAATRGLALPDLVQAIRGTPGTLIQLQVLPAGTPEDSPPTTLTLRRDQIKYRQGASR